MKTGQPADFELQILGVLWEHGPMTVRQVMEELTDGKERAYTSVLSVMQVMQKKGQLKTLRKRDGLANVYDAKLKRENVMTPLLKGLADRVFGGRASDVLQHLLGSEPVDPQEIERLRAMLDEIAERDNL
jgi:BlaI family penicillinase repressor